MFKKIKNNLYVMMFYISFASNPLLFILTPEHKTKNFIQIFSIFNLAFSFIVTLIFLNQYILNKIKLIFYLSICLFIINIYFFNIVGLYVFYIWMILFGDLIVSQIDTLKYSSIYRVINTISIIPLFINQNIFETILYFRILLSLIFISVIFFNKYKINQLLIQKSKNFFFITYIFYSGTLIFFSKYLLKFEVAQYKIWYMTIQIGLVLILKELDFKTRSNSKGGKDVFEILKYIKILLPFISLIYIYLKFHSLSVTDTLIIFIVYYISLYFLNFSKKYIKIA